MVYYLSPCSVDCTISHLQSLGLPSIIFLCCRVVCLGLPPIFVRSVHHWGDAEKADSELYERYH